MGMFLTSEVYGWLEQKIRACLCCIKPLWYVMRAELYITLLDKHAMAFITPGTSLVIYSARFYFRSPLSRLIIYFRSRPTSQKLLMSQ